MELSLVQYLSLFRMRQLNAYIDKVSEAQEASQHDSQSGLMKIMKLKKSWIIKEEDLHDDSPGNAQLLNPRRRR